VTAADEDAPTDAEAKTNGETKPSRTTASAKSQKSSATTRKKESSATEETASPKPAPRKAKESEEAPKASRRPRLDAEARRLLAVRENLAAHRPRFVRQASYRYWRIGRWESWRRPRGLQSKQRRHYGYRSQIVKVGYRSPKAVRGLTPSGFLPVVVRTEDEVGRLDAHRDAAIIARGVGTRRRLVLEEAARRRGIHVLNPLVRAEEET